MPLLSFAPNRLSDPILQCNPHDLEVGDHGPDVSFSHRLNAFCVGLRVSVEALVDRLILQTSFADAQVEELDVDGQLMLDVKTDDPGRLIGRQGATLGDLQYLLNRIVHRGDETTPRIVLDVGGYRRQAREQLIKRAKEGAEKVRRWGDVIELEPMNAYDRRIVHQSLKDDPDIETHSVEVEGSEKKVILLRPRRTLPRIEPVV